MGVVVATFKSLSCIVTTAASLKAPGAESVTWTVSAKVGFTSKSSSAAFTARRCPVAGSVATRTPTAVRAALFSSMVRSCGVRSCGVRTGAVLSVSVMVVAPNCVPSKVSVFVAGRERGSPGC